jgi:ComEC/Rec2-related protein
MLTRLKNAFHETAAKPSFRLPALTCAFFAGLIFQRYLDVPFSAGGCVMACAMVAAWFFAERDRRVADAAMIVFFLALGVTLLATEPHRRVSAPFIKAKEVRLPVCVRIDDAIGKAFRVHMDETHAAFTEGLMLGRGKIDRDLMRLFKDAGTAHAVAISGTHVIIIAGVLYLFVTMFGMSLRTRTALAAVLVLAYGALCYFKVPVLRSVVMYLAFCGAIVLQRPFLPYHTLFLAGLVTALFDPVSIFTVSFQLSFAAVLGLMLGNDLLVRYGFYAKKLTAAKKWITVPIFASFFATLLTTPITSFYFGKIYLLSWLSSLVAVPMLTIVIYAVFVYGAVFFVPPLAAAVGVTLTALIDANIVTNAFFAQMPGMSVACQMSLPCVVWYYAVLLAAWLWLMHRREWADEGEDIRLEQEGA